MKRRSVFGLLAALGSFLAWPGRLASAQTEPSPNPDPRRQEYEKAVADAIASIPYPRVATTGREALSTWERLKAEGKGWPVIVGSDDDLARIAEQWTIEGVTKPEDILARAAKLHHPHDLHALVAAQRKAGAEATREMLAKGDDDLLPIVIEIGPDGTSTTVPHGEVRERMAAELDDPEPSVGQWPADTAEDMPGLTIALDLNGKPLDRVHILVLPTMEAATAPAYLRWGGWNACPAPEYHVAALRDWHTRYGAEPVGISGDVINLRVARRPPTRDEALALAREQFLYCEDLVLQGTETFAPLAAGLMRSDWWYFWWD